MTQSTGSLQPGAELGPYKIEAWIGAGGMGEVFRAADTRLQRTVAIKLLPDSHAVDAAYRQRFLQEARAASALNHPNIISIYDISSHDGRDFLVMEYVDGRTLKDLIGAEGMPLNQAANLGAQIASALDAAHSAGIVHRDIKPANVMVTAGEQVKVLDFGLAKKIWAATDATAETQTVTDATVEGTVVGTVAYMSPEQARGETVDGRSDIFSLGAVLYEAVTGQLPFRGSSALAVMHEIGTGTPPPPSRLRSGVPASFDQLIAKCLEKKPAQRPSRASEVAEALKSLTLPAKIVSAPPRDGRRVVAVAPLQFGAALPEDQFLSVALADAIANRLGMATSLVVRPTSSVVKYAGKHADWTQIARELDVDVVVEGSIQKLGTRVRTLVQVWELRDARMLHSAKVDGEMGDLFGLQDRLADSVFDALAPQIREKPERIATPAARHPLAFELYMRAIDRALCYSKFELAAAIEMLGQAVELDPNFADAWGLMARVCVQMGSHLDPDPKWFAQAEQAISRTLELDPVNSDALCARGMIVWSPSRGFQFRPALRALNASLTINPSRPTARSFRGAVLFHLGFHEASIGDNDEAVLANPGFALAYASRGFAATYMGDYAMAEEQFQRALALEPTLVHANLFAPLPMIYSGEFEKARGRLAKARQMIPEEPQIASLEGLILAREGDFKRAEQLADEAASSKRSMTHSHHSWHCAAGIYALCGTPEKAIAELKRCAEGGLPNYRAFELDPHLRALQNHPEFTTLMRDLRRDYDSIREEFGLTETYAPHQKPNSAGAN